MILADNEYSYNVQAKAAPTLWYFAGYNWPNNLFWMQLQDFVYQQQGEV